MDALKQQYNDLGGQVGLALKIAVQWFGSKVGLEL
jgi:hypothetical protein